MFSTMAEYLIQITTIILEYLFSTYLITKHLSFYILKQCVYLNLKFAFNP